MCTVSGGAYGGGGSSATKSVTLTVTAASGFTATTLVGDTAAGGALVVDASLVNPWGVAFGPGFSWVANNHSETSTLYDGNGKAQPTAGPLVVSFPAGAGGTTFDPTGVVFNTTTSFVVSSAGKSAAAKFLFVGEGGMIAGWSPTVDATNAVVMYADAGGAVYKGLAIANNGSGDFLYATDFHNGKVDVFDASFARQAPTATSFAFTDPTLPAGYAPFGIAALKTGAGGAVQIFVTYAQQLPPDNHDNANGAGLGLVDVFDANGVFVAHLVPTGGRLNAPWGLALAPADFGTLSGALLVGNFGDGTINGYDPVSGSYVGTVATSGGAAFAAPGLWGIAFGNDADNQPHNTLFYAAGLNNEANGAYGRIDLGGAPVLNAPPVVAITSPTGGVTGTVAVSATATDNVAVAKVEFFANGASIGASTTAPFSVQWDTSTVANATAVQLTATATDVDGNVGTSPAVEVTVGTMTLSQLQTTIFTPRCSGCHTGVGTSLPGVQNLTAGNTYAAIVNVASIEQPALKRVAPNDPANSYLIRKLQGDPSITGGRMPFGGPYLDQATIDQVKTWINNGAPNN
ncbi:MAG: TIGR03118 family protein [Proteobacteria bacterium]|nr:TIGR03118 family protein [Pseudomonadota bacterium]